MEHTPMEDMALGISEQPKQSISINDVPIEEFAHRVETLVNTLQGIIASEERIASGDSSYYHGMFVGEYSTRRLAEKQKRMCTRLLEILTGEHEI